MIAVLNYDALTAFKQAISKEARWIITFNFADIWIYDMGDNTFLIRLTNCRLNTYPASKGSFPRHVKT